MKIYRQTKVQKKIKGDIKEKEKEREFCN